MYNVSQQYKEQVKKPIRNQSYMKIGLGLINQQAQSSARVDNQDQYEEYSDFTTVFSKNDIGNIYATYEKDFFKADGSMYFLPRNPENYRKNGIITKNLHSENSTIKFSFECGASDIRGLTIQFGPNYPTLFSVVTSDGTETEFENDSNYFETTTVFSNTTSITLKIKSMSSPNNRIRIYYIRFGLGIEYDNEWIISTESSSVLSLINESLPEINFTVTLKNEDSRFNVDNPSSEINFLESGQKLSVLYGYELDDGMIEWIQLHTLYVTEWSADDMQVRISASDIFKFMEDNYYKGVYYEGGIFLRDLAEMVFADAGISSSDYIIDSYLAKIYVFNPLPNVTHKEALQIIANAGRCIMDYDRYGKIRIYSAFTPEYEIASNGTAYFSDVLKIDSDTEKQRYATYEKDSFTADGSMYFLPKSSIANTGYVSSQISGDNCKFSENPVITKTLESKYKCFGIKIKFGDLLPSEFMIRTYADEAVVEEILINEEINKNYELSYEFKEFDKIEIEFTKTEIPNNRIHVDYISLGAETSYILEYDDLYSTPIGSQLEKIKDMRVQRTIYSEGTIQEELTNDTVVYNGENIFYFYDEACHRYSASSSAGTINIVNDGAYYVELRLTGVSIGQSVEITVNGYKYNVSNSYYSNEVNNRGTDKEWNNPLISDYEHAKDVCEWLSEYYSSGIEYELEYRGEPALDCGDIIFQENKYVSDLKTTIEEHQLTFNGGIEGSLRTRRKYAVSRKSTI